MRRWVEKLARLDAGRLRLLVEAAAIHIAIASAGRFASRSIAGERLSPHRARPTDPTTTARDVAWAVRTVTAIVPFRGTCLTRALTVERMLRRRGIVSTLRFGTARVDGNVLFHAWLEHAGVIMIGGDAPVAYRPLESCSAIAARTANSTAFAGSCRPVSHTL